MQLQTGCSMYVYRRQSFSRLNNCEIESSTPGMTNQCHCYASNPLRFVMKVETVLMTSHSNKILTCGVLSKPDMFPHFSSWIHFQQEELMAQQK